MEIAEIGDFREQRQGNPFCVEDGPEEVEIVRAGHFDREPLDQDLDVHEIARAGGAGAGSFHDGTVVGHLLADGAQFFADEHLRGVGEYRAAVDLRGLLGSAILEFADIDLELSLRSEEHGIAPHGFEVALAGPVLGNFDQLERNAVPAPKPGHLRADAGRLFFEGDIEHLVSFGGKNGLQALLQALTYVFELGLGEVHSHGQVHIEGCTCANLEDKVNGVSAFQDEALREVLIREHGHDNEALDPVEAIESGDYPWVLLLSHCVADMEVVKPEGGRRCKAQERKSEGARARG